MTKRKIGYIMSRFPHLPETFILREMTELEKYPIDICLFPLIRQNAPTVHQEAIPWVEKANFTPYISSDILKANIKYFLKFPSRYISALIKVVYYNIGSLNFLIRALILFPKSVYLARQGEELGIDHFHVHYATHPALAAWIINYFTGIDYSVTVHAHDIFIRKAMLSQKLCEAKFIIAISEFNKCYLSEKVDSSLLDKTHVVHCGIRPEDYQETLGSTRSDSSIFTILSIGSLQIYKGHKYLISACERLRNLQIQFHCHIIGEGEERSNLEALIRGFNLEDYITLHGAMPQEDVGRYLQIANCYVQPSIIAPNKKMEGIPVAIMEAMAAGLPVVATGLSGIPEIVHDGKTGLLVPEKDPTALANAIVYYYQHPKEANKIAESSKEYVKREFNLSITTSKIYRLFLGNLSNLGI